MSIREVLRVAVLLAVLLLTACTGASTEVSPLPTASPGPAQDAAGEPIELTVLHTNDNWGETEPCG